ncbi:FYRC-domain-containing protein, partial [Ramicandelaber brevisporus]
PVDRNADGTYILPVMIGVIKVLSLGEVVFDRPSYHSDRYIYPAGYSIQRLFGSMITPDKHVLYTCTILDGGNQPLFRVVAEDCPDKPIEWASATGAWSKVVRQVNAVRKKEASNSISGPDLFGLTHATIAKMIQDLPNVEKCPNYVPQNFI